MCRGEQPPAAPEKVLGANGWWCLFCADSMSGVGSLARRLPQLLVVMVLRGSAWRDYYDAPPISCVSARVNMFVGIICVLRWDDT